ncbi:arylsulfatase [Rhizobium favelukesii]|uniref:Arylsulfatase n=1 Tax=Rhizobium favelukesii TaxID=348824 RepID=W6S321_9HYPH|nr:arylsulfatase [Rhizobium favelukesii]MCS0460204.1 arylsulfatase [Rhizobium favelukesii]CDM60781.1 arylsulfatase [Rhizobium favelukesii]
MKTRVYLAVFAASCFSVFPATAQEVTGTLGSPSATSTIDGQSLPATPPAFGGTINLDAKASTPWWPPTVVPPKGAPNVLLIITDDAGYGVAGTFGGVIPTPTLDQIAANGLRFTQFHSTALCSPTRAALITGRNHHSSGFGVIAEQATGFPGYDSIIGPENATIGNILKNHGYATSWFGKDHNTPTYNYSMSGPFDQWPSGMGFDYFYGFMGGETNQWTPWLFRDHTQIFPWEDQPGYNLTTAMADEAINYLRQTNAATPEKPFFLYYAPGATHAPHHPTKEWIDKFKGKFDMGWNAMRDQIFANQKRLGVIPESTQLTPWPDDLPKWDTLNPDEKKMFARQAEVYAAYVAYADNEIGRVVDEVRKQGKLNNTLIIYIEGDNGTSAEGSTIGTAFDLAAIQGINMPVADQLKYYDAWGSDVTTPHMSVAWSWAFDTPFKWTKQIASHFGGTRQGIAMSWPGHITDKGGIRSQFHHVIDIVPTILEATGIKAPQTVNGIAQKPIEGISMAYTWSKGGKDVPSARQTQYFEMFGNRAIYHDGWIASTTPDAGPWLLGLGKLPNVLDGYNWELYDLTKDFSQFDDLATKEPAKLKELQDQFLVEAAKYQVFPLDNRVATRFGQQPSATAGRDTFTYTGELSGLPPSAAPSPLTRSYTITAEVDVPEGGGEGVINTLGGRFGGYGLYLLKGKPVFTYNLLGLERFRWEGKDALTSGKHTIVFDFTYQGPGFAKGGTGVLSVDGAEVAKQAIPHTIPFIATIDESFDVGVDTRSPIDDKDYQVPFRFTGTLDKLTVKVGPPQI